MARQLEEIRLVFGYRLEAYATIAQSSIGFQPVR